MVNEWIEYSLRRKAPRASLEKVVETVVETAMDTAMNTDYLVVGAGATGLAFADALLSETEATITLVDRRAEPGGHWNDAYPFVRLHQPSEFYGVNSAQLGNGRITASGFNAGMHEMATGLEVRDYFHDVARTRLAASGRVHFLAATNYLGDGVVQSMTTGVRTQVDVRRKIVDASLISPAIPATHKPAFEIAGDVRLLTPNVLPGLLHAAAAPITTRRFCILGAGKTAMDTVIWLIGQGVPADAIQWVRPRDSWMANRIHVQPGRDFFHAVFGGESFKLAAFANARTVQEVFLKLETTQQMLRIDLDIAPTMFHYAILSVGELAVLRQVRRVIRKGRVIRVSPEGLELERGNEALAAGTLLVDCTASAINPAATRPVFSDRHIAIQLLRCPLVTLSAAVTAYVEAHGSDDVHKNALCRPVPFPKSPHGYAEATYISMLNQHQWSRNQGLREWLRKSRLQPYSQMASAAAASDPACAAVMQQLQENAIGAMQNFPKLIEAGARPL